MKFRIKAWFPINLVLTFQVPMLKLVSLLVALLKQSGDLNVGLKGENRTLLNNILCRKVNWIGHSEKKLPPSWCHWRTDDGSERSRKKKNTASWWFEKWKKDNYYWKLYQKRDRLKYNILTKTWDICLIFVSVVHQLSPEGRDD